MPALQPITIDSNTTIKQAMELVNTNFTTVEEQFDELEGVDFDAFRNPLVIFLASDGNDSNNGHSYAEAVATVNKAVELANAIIDSSPVGTRVLISVSPGNYVFITNPVRVRHHVSIMGDALRSVVFRPAPGKERDGFFKVDDAFYCWGLTFKGHQADSEKVGWVFQFDNEANNTARGATGLGAYITASPYCQNCSSITAEDDDGFAPSRSTGDTGGGFLIDREACAPNTPIASFVVDSFTQVNLDGIGCKVVNDAYAQLVSFFGTFCRYHVLTETGGQVNFTGGTTDFGTYGLVANGYSKTPLYKAKAQRNHYGVRRSELAFTVTAPTTLTFAAHGLLNGAPVTVKTATQLNLPAALVVGTTYYVVQKTADTIKLAATVGGTPLTVNGATSIITVVNQGELAVYCDNFTANRIGSASRPGNGVLMFPQLAFPRTGSLAANAATPGTVNTVEQSGEVYTAVAILGTSPAIVGKHDYVLNSGTVTVTRVGIFVNSQGQTIPTVPVAGLNTYTFNVTHCDYNHLTGITKFRAQNYIPSALDSFYFTNCKFICPLSAYIVTSSEPINQFGQVVEETSPQKVGYKVNVYNATNGGLIYPILEDAYLDFRRFSYISAPAHVFEYVGSGTNYSALPENGGVPSQSNAYQEVNNGRVFISWTNEKGDFGVSNRFLVDGTTGEVTISASSFNLSGLNQIGPFSRNGGFSTAGVVLKEVSDNRNMISSLGIPDANTVPTQTAVVDYLNETLALSLPNGAIVNDTAFYFSGQEPYPTIRIDDTPVKAGDVLWDKTKSNWYTFDGTAWILARYKYVPEIARGAFTTVWDTTKLSTGSTANNQIKLPLISQGVYDFIVDWGDGTTSTIQAWNAAAATHTYATAGIYTVNITGIIHGFCFNNGGDRLKLRAIAQWGILRVATPTYSGASSFSGCSNLIFLNNDFLDTTNLTSLANFFRDCSSITTIPGLSIWDVSNVTDINSMFQSCTNFNQPLNNWDVSNVTTMTRTFSDCVNFNQPLNNWNVSNVTNMYLLFYSCTNFNQPLNNWNVSNVTNMAILFSRCYNFNQPLNNWNVSNVTDMTSFLVNANNWDNTYYDACLLAWSALTLKPNVVAHFGDAKYTQSAAAARAILTSAPNNWTITDGGAA